MNKILDKYDTLIFDMDGVITSENGYWDAASLTVREFLVNRFDGEDIDVSDMSQNVKKIRSEVFFEDKLITLLKGMGVNSNWDLGYITVLIALVTGSCDAQDIYEYAKQLKGDIIDIYDRLAVLAAKVMGENPKDFMRSGKLWTDMRDCFQEWYLGDKLFIEVYGCEPKTLGKMGIYKGETPIIPLDKLKAILSELSHIKRLGIGTGRLRREIVPLLREWDVLHNFDENALCTYDYVVSAEKSIGATLTKPHPYMFLKSLYGLDYPDDKIAGGDYDKSKISKTLVIGDAGADILAAQAMGADFCAVLTGVAGQSGRAYFEEQKSTYILDDITYLV